MKLADLVYDVLSSENMIKFLKEKKKVLSKHCPQLS
jgi:hypothetical protein